MKRELSTEEMIEITKMFHFLIRNYCPDQVDKERKTNCVNSCADCWLTFYDQRII